MRLASNDPDLGRALNRYGPPPLWARPAGYATLVRIILEQQVSLASGRSAFSRLTRGTDRITPAYVLRLGRDRLRDLGLTRQKARLHRRVGGGYQRWTDRSLSRQPNG